ncbi:MAG TPA: PAS domain-containing protein [Bryobacteraceae bacterium]|jgi:PAS domain-containing protein|nr:PAS domain-containing protein [Bryobacteraceae bacterium]
MSLPRGAAHALPSKRIENPASADTYCGARMTEDLDPSHYRAILESLSTGVYVVDRERKILFWNDGAERITGYLRRG